MGVLVDPSLVGCWCPPHWPYVCSGWFLWRNCSGRRPAPSEARRKNCGEWTPVGKYHLPRLGVAPKVLGCCSFNLKGTKQFFTQQHGSSRWAPAWLEVGVPPQAQHRSRSWAPARCSYQEEYSFLLVQTTPVVTKSDDHYPRSCVGNVDLPCTCFKNLPSQHHVWRGVVIVPKL